MLILGQKSDTVCCNTDKQVNIKKGFKGYLDWIDEVMARSEECPKSFRLQNRRRPHGSASHGALDGSVPVW